MLTHHPIFRPKAAKGGVTHRNRRNMPVRVLSHFDTFASVQRGRVVLSRTGYSEGRGVHLTSSPR